MLFRRPRGTWVILSQEYCQFSTKTWEMALLMFAVLEVTQAISVQHPPNNLMLKIKGGCRAYNLSIVLPSDPTCHTFTNHLSADVICVI